MKLNSRFFLNNRYKSILTLIPVAILVQSTTLCTLALAQEEVRPVKRTWGPVKADRQISVEIENGPDITVCREVVANITIKNVGTTEFSFGEVYPELVFDILVKNEKGEVMPMTKYGQHLAKPADGVVRTKLAQIKVKPGAEHSYRILINQLFDMTVPAQYRITASKKFSGKAAGSIDTIVSNVAQVNINDFEG